ncbi:protein AmpG [Candidatus Magnetobacterium bavaricum]|uniref:Protein AmpG n=1 Tax=Candidatus Magnetobacterium bavaricum TaxID=29290 RepID=A0A0F3GQT3_9BACT|nr:protein AmpG [Candidatus Magnetobacterium bavaricum]
MSFESTRDVLSSRRIAMLLPIGFASGLPLALTGSTLQALMTSYGVDIRTIGLFALVGLPYTVKFLWSPLLDHLVPPYLGRRRGWMLLMQLALMLSVVLMAMISPRSSPILMATIALIVTMSSASLDIVADAYRTDILASQERGLGAGVFITGYRIAMLTSGALALVISDHIGWQATYLLMAGVMAIGLIGIILAPEPRDAVKPPKNLQEAVWGPLKDYFTRDSAIKILLFIVMYKLSDAYAGSLTTAFLLKGMGFSATEVGTINKGLGLVSTVLGAMFGGTLMIRLGLFRSLFLFGILQGVSNLLFMALAYTGKSYAMLVVTVAVENLTSGMGTASFVAFIMSLCNQRYSATQYALLSSLAAMGRILIAPTSGIVVEAVGWANFFLITALTAIPGMALLPWLHKDIEDMANANKS